MNYLKLNGDIMMKKLFYMVAASLLFTSELSYAKSKKIPDFSGEWGGRYEGCEFNSTGWFKFKQKGRLVSGEWSASAIKAWSGKLKGKIIGNKLFVYYCYDPSDENEKYICPKYENKPGDYFIKKGNRLMKYVSFGDGYRFDSTEYIYKMPKGGNIRVTKEKNCN